MQTETLQPDQIRRVVVRGTNWLGDAVMSVPALRQLRRMLPSAHIARASRPGTVEVFADVDFVDEVMVCDPGGIIGAWNQVRAWRRGNFDLALLFPNAFQAAAIAFLSRVPVRTGYGADGRHALLTHPVPVPDWKDQRHEIFYYLNLVNELETRLFGRAPTDDQTVQFTLSVSEEHTERAREIRRLSSRKAGAPVVLLCPGAVNSRAKCWPAERYAALADRFLETGASVALIGSPAEEEVSRKVCARMRRQPIVLTGRTTVAEAMALISVADILITNDTGAAHIGSAVGTPTVVIFGPTNPLTTRPFRSTAEIIRFPPDCSPCMLRDCPIDHRCMTAITPEEVFGRALALMSGQAARVTV